LQADCSAAIADELTWIEAASQGRSAKCKALSRGQMRIAPLRFSIEPQQPIRCQRIHDR
jgi:hypothetical protein